MALAVPEKTPMETKQHDGKAIVLAYSVPEFCTAHRISRALFYLLQRDGRAPAVIKAGRRTLISAESAARWRAAMEAATQETA
jgi:hypothetical protein